MKKLILAALIAVFAVPAYAGIDEGIDKGMTHVFVLGGAAFPTTQYENATGDIDFGGMGFTYGAQIMHYLAPAFGLGVEFNGVNYPNESTNGVKLKADKYSFLVAGKINLMPAEKTRLYIPFAGGMANYKLTEENVGSESFTKPAFYVGLGVETDLNDIFLIGFEGRYNMWWIDKDEIGCDNDYLSDASILLKIGLKF